MIENSLNYSTKFKKKLVKARAKLTKENLQFSDESTKYIVISNGGLANGVQRSILEDIIHSFEDLIMPPQKSYAMVSFKDIKTSESVFEKLQGHVLKSTSNLASPNPILYLHYVKGLNSRISGNTETPGWNEVPGLILLENFITETEENELLSFLEAESPVSNGNNSSDNLLKHRKVWHYGYEFRYKYNDVNPNLPLKEGIPDILKSVITKLKKTGHIDKEPNQITINKYEPGQGIPPHIDNTEAFDETLASLSLNSRTVMDFRNSKTVEHNQVLVKERSLLIFTGEARYKWTHGICPRKIDLVPAKEGDNNQLTSVNRGMRISITFRRVREDYKGPSQNPDVGRPVNEEEAATLEEEHVHKVYDEIASHFTSTREKPWPKIKQFIDELEPHSTIMDVGCGSGRYLGVRSDVHMIGCDRSQNLIGICKEKGFEVFTCDGLNLSLRPGIFDACICIAVIHHYSTHDRRKKAIEQLLQLVRVGGRVLISVWALEQEYKRVKSKYLKRIDGSPPDNEASSEPNQSAIKNLIQPQTQHDSFQQTDANYGTSNPKNDHPLIATNSDTVTNSLPENDKNTVQNTDMPQTQNDNALKVCEDDHDSTNTAIDVSSDNQTNLPAGYIQQSSDNDASTLPVHKNRTPFEQQDVLVPWHRKTVQNPKEKVHHESPKVSESDGPKSHNLDKTINVNSKTFHRYYHVFKQGELEELCKSFNNVEVVTSYYDEGNWCVILKKVS